MCDNETIKSLDAIASKISQRSKRQRRNFDDYDDYSPSRRVKGLWTSGREDFGLQKIFIYVPVQSEIPLKELADLLIMIDGKLERAGSFKRILCPYGDIKGRAQEGEGSILKGHFKIGADQWLAALTMMTETGAPPAPVPFSSFGVPYQHAFGSRVTTRPRREDPIVIVAPHRDITASEKLLRAFRGFRKNLTWVFHDEKDGWSMETKSFFPELAREGWHPDDQMIEDIQRRLLSNGMLCDAFTASHEEFVTCFLTPEERNIIPKELTTKDYWTLVSKCLYEPIIKSCSDGVSIGSFEVVGDRMVHELIDNKLATVETSKGESFLLEIRQWEVFLDDNRTFFKAHLDATADNEHLMVVVAGDLHIQVEPIDI